MDFSKIRQEFISFKNHTLWFILTITESVIQTNKNLSTGEEAASYPSWVAVSFLSENICVIC